MLTSIHPFGERVKGNRFGVTAAAHVVGALVGGASLGLAIGLIGVALREVLAGGVRAGVLAVAALGAVIVELTRLGSKRWVAGWHRQVDEAWLDEFRGTVYGFGYGVQLGFGLVTIVTSAITWVVVLAILLQSSLLASIGIGTMFGLVRGFDLLRVRGVRDGATLRELMRVHHGRALLMRRGTAVALLAAGGVLLAGVAA